MDGNPSQHDGLWVTVYTDASFRLDTKWAAWAAWLRCSEGRCKKSFICPPEVTSAFQAEYYSILMGITLAVEKFKPQGILVCNDCDQAIKATWPWNKAQDQVAEWRKQIDEIREGGIQIRTKFVKAHAGGGTIQSWLNEWCDRACKKERKKAEGRCMLVKKK